MYLTLRKTYFSSRKNIFQTKHRSHRIFPMIAYFPFVYVIRLLHMFDWRYSSLFLFILLCNCYRHGWIVRILRQWESFFSQYSPAYQNKAENWRQNFYHWASGVFYFPVSMCRISASFWSKRNLQWHLCENNVYFLPYNLLHD